MLSSFNQRGGEQAKRDEIAGEIDQILDRIDRTLDREDAKSR